MNKPEPAFRIPANAEIRNPANWFSPSSLCRTCIYQFLQEPFCKTVTKSGKYWIELCSGYERETQINPEISTLSYTEIVNNV
jgi:hypothetical protein